MEDLAQRMQMTTDRYRQFLNNHNTRRKAWHERYNNGYVPLSWDNLLKAETKVWAETLLASCDKGIYHDPHTKYGECATTSQGTGSLGKLQIPDDIVRRFVEREQNWQPPQNSHLTQVLWRSTKYVGCAEALKSMGQGKTCHTQVCWYARPGKEILMLLLFTPHSTQSLLNVLYPVTWLYQKIVTCRNTRAIVKIGGLNGWCWRKSDCADLNAHQVAVRYVLEKNCTCHRGKWRF